MLTMKSGMLVYDLKFVYLAENLGVFYKTNLYVCRLVFVVKWGIEIQM